MVYSLEQRCFMVECMHKYGSPTLAQRAFRKKYPKLQPSLRCFKYQLKKFHESGSLQQRPGSGRTSLRKERALIIKPIIERYPDKSLRALAEETGISYSGVYNVLRKVLKLKPYKKSSRHGLQSSDYAKAK